MMSPQSRVNASSSAAIARWTSFLTMSSYSSRDHGEQLLVLLHLVLAGDQRSDGAVRQSQFVAGP